MRQRNSYSRIVQELEDWQHLSKGLKIQLFQHCIENNITSFLINFSNPAFYDRELGTALSESQLSRDEIQLIANLRTKDSGEHDIVSEVEQILEILKTDYLDLIFIDGKNASEEKVSALGLLQSRGKLKETGVSNLKNEQDPEWNFPLPCKARLSSLTFNRGSIKSLTLEKPTSKEISKMLFLESTGEENQNEHLEAMSQKYGLLPKELLFAWLLEHPGHLHPIIKGKSEAVIDSAAKALNTRLIKEDRLKLPDLI